MIADTTAIAPSTIGDVACGDELPVVSMEETVPPEMMIPVATGFEGEEKIGAEQGRSPSSDTADCPEGGALPEGPENGPGLGETVGVVGQQRAASAAGAGGGRAGGGKQHGPAARRKGASGGTASGGANNAPSLGSRGHEVGRCKPCAFFHTKGCETGAACTFCHLCPEGEKERRRQLKRHLRRGIMWSMHEERYGGYHHRFRSSGGGGPGSDHLGSSRHSLLSRQSSSHSRTASWISSGQSSCFSAYDDDSTTTRYDDVSSELTSSAGEPFPPTDWELQGFEFSEQHGGGAGGCGVGPHGGGLFHQHPNHHYHNRVEAGSLADGQMIMGSCGMIGSHQNGGQQLPPLGSTVAPQQFFGRGSMPATCSPVPLMKQPPSQHQQQQQRRQQPQNRQLQQQLQQQQQSAMLRLGAATAARMLAEASGGGAAAGTNGSPGNSPPPTYATAGTNAGCVLPPPFVPAGHQQQQQQQLQQPWCGNFVLTPRGGNGQQQGGCHTTHIVPMQTPQQPPQQVAFPYHQQPAACSGGFLLMPSVPEQRFGRATTRGEEPALEDLEEDEGYESDENRGVGGFYEDRCGLPEKEKQKQPGVGGGGMQWTGLMDVGGGTLIPGTLRQLPPGMVVCPVQPQQPGMLMQAAPFLMPSNPAGPPGAVSVMCCTMVQQQPCSSPREAGSSTTSASL